MFASTKCATTDNDKRNILCDGTSEKWDNEMWTRQKNEHTLTQDWRGENIEITYLLIAILCVMFYKYANNTW